jgi:hypothetical protein
MIVARAESEPCHENGLGILYSHWLCLGAERSSYCHKLEAGRFSGVPDPRLTIC